MKYFIDTEFIEGTKSKTFCGIKYGETKPTIDLISIGIVSEDGREYYAISKDFNLKEAWNRYDIKTMTNLPGDTGTNKMKVYWIRDNVLKPIFKEFAEKESRYYLEMYKRINVWTKYIDDDYYKFTYRELKRLIKKYGKTNDQIAEEVIKFVRTDKNTGIYFNSEPTFYGYYSDYDWVVFCWLFGKMIDLPKGFPMYCIDLKQLLDDKIKDKVSMNCRLFHKQLDANAFNNGDLTEALAITKTLPGYPKQTNEHNALNDAIFCRDLYEFLNKI